MRTSNGLKKYIDNASQEEIEKILAAVFLLKTSRFANYQTFYKIFDSPIFSEEIMGPLKKMVDWDEKDTEQAKLKVEKLESSIKGITMKERRESSGKLFTEIFKLVATGAIAGTAGYVAGRLLKKENKKDAEK